MNTFKDDHNISIDDQKIIKTISDLIIFIHNKDKYKNLNFKNYEDKKNYLKKIIDEVIKILSKGFIKIKSDDSIVKMSSQITLKTGICLILSLTIMGVQIFWK